MDIDGGVFSYNLKVNKSINKIRKHSFKYIKTFEEYGWRLVYIKKHIQTTDDDLSLVDIVKTQLQYDYERLGASPLSVNVLYDLGFKKVRATEYFNIIKELINTSYSNEQLLDIIIEYANGDYSPIGIPGNKFLYKETTVNQYYKVNGYDCINLNSFADNELLKTTIEKNQAKFKFYFHATLWGGAENIMNKGIDHELGRWCLDFGMKPSFYLTPDWNVAIEWCKKCSDRWKSECCIIAFKIPLSKKIDKEYHNPTQDWQINVKESRQCKNKFKSNQSLDQYGTVYGPMAINIYEIKTKDATPITHRIPRNQLALKNIAADRYFTNHIHSFSFETIF